MAEDKKLNKLDNDNLKEVSGGQTIGEWAAEVKRKRQIQPGPARSQVLVGQGQSGEGNNQEFWEDVWCPLCKAHFRANIMLDEVHCPVSGHPPISIKG